MPTLVPFYHSTAMNCLNCNHQIKEKDNFCSHCGQQNREKLTLQLMFYNTLSNYFSVDARFFKSIFPLVIKPGFLPLEFVKGKRRSYLHPAQMYLFISVVFFFLFSFIAREATQEFDNNLKNESEIFIERDATESSQIIENQDKKTTLNIDLGELDKPKLDSLIAEGKSDQEILKAMGMSANTHWLKKRFYSQSLKFYKSRNGASLMQTFFDSIPISMFFLLPVFAFILWMFHLRKGSFAYHLVFSFYYFSFLFLMFAFVIIFNFWFAIPEEVYLLLLGLFFVYLVIGTQKFYQQKWRWSILKSATTLFLFSALVLPFAFIIITLGAFLFS